MMSASLLMAVAALAVTSAADAGVSARPLEYDRPIAAADLAGRTLRELAIMRQYPLARAGGTMPAWWLQHYFNDQGRPWYRRVKVPAKLKPLDRDNIAAIDRYQASLPKADLEARYRALLVHQYGQSNHGPLAFSADGRRLAAICNDEVTTWDASSGGLLRTFDFPVAELLAFSADGRRLYTLMTNGFRFFDVATGKRLDGGDKELTVEFWDGAFNRDRSRVLLWVGDPDEDGNPEHLAQYPLTLLELGSMKEHDLSVKGEVLLAGAFSADEKTAIALSQRGAFYTFDVGTHAVTSQHQPRTPIDSRNAKLSVDGRLALIPWPPGELSVLESATAEQRARLKPPVDDAIAKAIFSSDAKTVFAGTKQGRLLQFDLAAPDRPRTLRPPTLSLRVEKGPPVPDPPEYLTLSSDGRRLAFSGGHSSTVFLWDLLTGKPDPAWANHVPFRSAEDTVDLLLLAETLRRPIPPSVKRLGRRPK